MRRLLRWLLGRRRAPTPPRMLPGAAWREAERLRAERERLEALRAHQGRLWDQDGR